MVKEPPHGITVIHHVNESTVGVLSRIIQGGIRRRNVHNYIVSMLALLIFFYFLLFVVIAVVHP